MTKNRQRKSKGKNHTRIPPVSRNKRLIAEIDREIDRHGSQSEEVMRLLGEYGAALYNQYNEQLMRQGYPDIDRILTAYDVIDPAGAYEFDEHGASRPLPDVVALADAYVEDMGWLAYAPCLPEGVLILPAGDKRTRQYFQFRHIDAEQRIMTLRVVTCEEHEGFSVYVADVAADVRIDDDDITIMTESPTRTMSEIYTSVNMHRHGWNDRDGYWWKQTVCRLRELEAEYDQESLTLTDAVFTRYTVMSLLTTMAPVNALMRSMSPTESHACRIGEDTAIIMGDRDYVPQRTEHVFGDKLRIRSCMVPEAPVASVRYTKADWRVRGHMRTSKLGKRFYVRPHMAHRNGLDSNLDDLQQTVYRIKKLSESSERSLEE